MRWVFIVLSLLACQASAVENEIVATCHCSEWGLQKYPCILDEEPLGGWDYSFEWDSPEELKWKLFSWGGFREYTEWHNKLSSEYELSYEHCCKMRRKALRNFRVSSCLAVGDAERDLKFIEYEWKTVLPDLQAAHRSYIRHRLGVFLFGQHGRFKV